MGFRTVEPRRQHGPRQNGAGVYCSCYPEKGGGGHVLAIKIGRDLAPRLKIQIDDFLQVDEGTDDDLGILRLSVLAAGDPRGHRVLKANNAGDLHIRVPLVCLPNHSVDGRAPQTRTEHRVFGSSLFLTLPPWVHRCPAQKADEKVTAGGAPAIDQGPPLPFLSPAEEAA
jgi:hypothetical protein